MPLGVVAVDVDALLSGRNPLAAQAPVRVQGVDLVARQSQADLAPPATTTHTTIPTSPTSASSPRQRPTFRKPVTPMKTSCYLIKHDSGRTLRGAVFDCPVSMDSMHSSPPRSSASVPSALEAFLLSQTGGQSMTTPRRTVSRSPKKEGPSPKSNNHVSTNPITATRSPFSTALKPLHWLQHNSLGGATVVAVSRERLRDLQANILNNLPEGPLVTTAANTTVGLVVVNNNGF